ncbi:LCP family protein [Microbispora sp. KK1-11]|uniref:LCP family protein n=1 Tax=Microbispora sp. KK1-11 TaxID=2053005 RepID=UPI00115BE9C9|nr:LCP family protein [Microbispora sp. KK1-11]TQS25208.1 LytR family transcriptional regulator [Microbispora sp. KK1-11]
MDDLTMLRDLGRGLEHEPPAGLARQRRRLLDEAAGGRRRRLTPWAGGRRAGWIALAAVAVVTAALVVVPTVLLRGTTGAHTVAPPTGDRPPKKGKALTVLLLGSDRRATSTHVGDLGERSDLMILLRLSADRKRATAVSLPRDSMVRIPQCRSAGGKTVAAHRDMINQAYAIGGLTCAWKTVETTTGVRVDHAVAIRYDGLEKLVDALGGVEVTVPQAVDDPKAKLKLPAGRSVLDGRTAVAYARLRFALGDGSDIMRIKRNVILMQAMLKKVSRLDDPAALASFVRVAATSVTTDAGLDLDTMLALARDVQRAGTRVTAVTVPWRPSVTDPNRIEWQQPDAARLFERLVAI